MGIIKIAVKKCGALTAFESHRLNVEASCSEGSTFMILPMRWQHFRQFLYALEFFGSIFFKERKNNIDPFRAKRNWVGR